MYDTMSIEKCAECNYSRSITNERKANRILTKNGSRKLVDGEYLIVCRAPGAPKGSHMIHKKKCPQGIW